MANDLPNNKVDLLKEVAGGGSDLPNNEIDLLKYIAENGSGGGGGGGDLKKASIEETYLGTNDSKYITPKSLVDGIFSFNSKYLLKGDPDYTGAASIGAFYGGDQGYGDFAKGQVSLGASADGNISVGYDSNGYVSIGYDANLGVSVGSSKLHGGSQYLLTPQGSVTFDQIYEKVFEADNPDSPTNIEKATMEDIREGSDENKMVTPKAVKDAFFYGSNFNFFLDGYELTSSESPKLYLASYYKDDIVLGFHAQKTLTLGSNNVGNINIGYNAKAGINIGSVKGNHSTKKLISGNKSATFEQIIDKAHETGGGGGDVEFATENETYNMTIEDKAVSPKSLKGIFSFNSQKLTSNDESSNPGEAHIGYSYKASQYYGSGAAGKISLGLNSQGGIEIGSTAGNQSKNKLIAGSKTATFEAIINKANEVTTLGGVTDGSLLNKVLLVEVAGERPTKAEVEEVYGRPLAVIQNYIVIDESKKKRWDIVIGNDDIYVTDERNLYSLT